MKLYTNLVRIKTTSVIFPLRKAWLGQSWQAKFTFRVLVKDNVHIFAGWLGVWFICGVVILNISLSGAQHIGTVNTFRVFCCLGPFSKVQILTGGY